MAPASGHDETKRATRLVAWLTLLALVVYAATGLVIREDAALTRYGTTEQVHFVARRAAALDRDARYGDRPVVWILGSSIARESFDEDLLTEQLPGWGVEKYAFDRGGPIFAWALLDRLDVRPGDKVVTVVSPDHFRRDWLRYHEGLSTYLHFLFTPAQVARIRSLPWAERLDYALANAPPESFWDYREPWRAGVEAWVEYELGLRRRKPRKRDKHRYEPYQEREYVRDFRNLPIVRTNRMADDELALEPGQVSYDAITWIVEQAHALGAEPVLVHVPHNPEYYDRFVSEDLPARFEAHMHARFPSYVRLGEQPVDAFMDYKHPNFRGRPPLTLELAEHLRGTGVAGDD